MGVTKRLDAKRLSGWKIGGIHGSGK